MKTLLLLQTVLSTLVGATQTAHAVPVMNENTSTTRVITIFPDHADANAYYIAPNVSSVCLDEDGAPRFSYQDIATTAGTQGIVQMTLCARFAKEELDAAQSAITQRNSNARFSTLPFLSSKVVFNEVLNPFIVKQTCTHSAGMVGDEQTCSFRLNRQGRRIFLRQVLDRIAMSHHFEYSVAGFIRKPDGTFDSQTITYGLAVRIGGDELRQHRNLFIDTNGWPLWPAANPGIPMAQSR